MKAQLQMSEGSRLFETTAAATAVFLYGFPRGWASSFFGWWLHGASQNSPPGEILHDGLDSATHSNTLSRFVHRVRAESAQMVNEQQCSIER